MEAALKLLPTEEITEKNVVEAVKRLNTVTIKLADKNLDRDLRVLTELKEIHSGIGELNGSIQTLTSDMDQGFDRLGQKFTTEIGKFQSEVSQLKTEMIEVKAEMVEVKTDIKQIKGVLTDIKDGFIQEQQQTNALLKELIAKK